MKAYVETAPRGVSGFRTVLRTGQHAALSAIRSRPGAMAASTRVPHTTLTAAWRATANAGTARRLVH